MLVFDKSVTLFDKLKEYDKESLKLYGSDRTYEAVQI